jgi:hypothetical protein
MRFSASTGSPGPGRRRRPGGRRRERGDIADFEQDPGCGPDPDAGHRDQDLGERVRIKHLLQGGEDLLVPGLGDAGDRQFGGTRRF